MHVTKSSELQNLKKLPKKHQTKHKVSGRDKQRESSSPLGRTQEGIEKRDFASGIPPTPAAGLLKSKKSTLLRILAEASFLFLFHLWKQASNVRRGIKKASFDAFFAFAVRGGFEPPEPFPVRQFSKLLVLATHPPHQKECKGKIEL